MDRPVTPLDTASAAPDAQPRGQAIVVPVLGMHRSGTSMFTRALNLLGVTLGEPLMQPQPDNPKGFWKNEFFYEIDMRILHATQNHVSGYGSRDALLTIPSLSHQVERSAETLGVIDTYLKAQFSTSAVWGWKDPRSVLLFPFWLSALVELGYRQIRPTVITRHPFAVVGSLTRRSDLSGVAAALGCTTQELALQMWTAYSHILLDIIEQTQCFVSAQEWYLHTDSASAELLRCRHYLGLSAESEALTAALEWLDPGAVHERTPESFEHLPGADEALLLHEDLMARATAQRADWRLAPAA